MWCLNTCVRGSRFGPNFGIPGLKIETWGTQSSAQELGGIVVKPAFREGGLVPGAKVPLSGPAGAVKTTTADKTGSYTFAAVPPGSYTVLASAPRLAQAAPAEVSLKAGLQVLNLMLKVASIAEKVTVEDSSAPAIGTDSSSS